MSTEFEILKQLSPETSLVMHNGMACVLRKISYIDIPLFEKLKELSCNNLVKIYDIVSLDGAAYITEEYIAGYTIEQRIEQGCLFSEQEVIEIVTSICKGLRVLHNNSIVHRDITPSNIVIGNETKIIDYGISRSVKKNKTRDTQILGTQGFAAPEQFGFSQTDTTADIYALGVLINYMLTGALPYQKLCDGRLRHIVLRCTQIDPQKRYHNVEEIVNELKGKGFRNFYMHIVGFRTNTLWKKIVAVVYYSLSIIFTIGMLGYCNSTVKDYFGSAWFCFFGVYMPVVTLADFKYWSKHLLPNAGKGEQIMVRIIATIISVLLGSIVFSIIQTSNKQ